MTRSVSRYLDALRAAAALVVVASHFAYARFSGGDYLWIRRLNLGSDAVIVFFVLSGFIIDFAADRKDPTLGQFAFSRATRVYSVALPALLLTLMFDQVGSRFFPDDYSGWWYEGQDLSLRALTALTFTNEWWFLHLRPGTNGPYWSLTYEVWYYAIFAALKYGSRARGPWVAAALSLLAGPKILLLSPAFALGVWVHRSSRNGLAVGGGRVWLYALGAPFLYVALLGLGAPAELRAITESVLGAELVQTKLGFSDEFVWNAVIGSLVALHLLGVQQLLSRPPRVGTGIVATALERGGALAHFLAGGSFSLYLVHYPAMQLVASALPGAPGSIWRQLTLLTCVLFCCFGFAALFERRLPELRFYLRNRAPGIPPA